MSKKIDPHVLKQYKIGDLIGSGAYGHVWKVQDRSTNQEYALKKVFGAFRNNIDAQRTYRQVEILQKITHANIIKLVKVLGAENKEDLYLIFELMEADLLAVVGSNILTHNHQKYIIFQILKAIDHLHQLKLLHRDLKPSNVLIDSNCNVKICDFGLVRSLAVAQEEHPILSEQVATRWYRAPQLLLGSRTYNYPADLWSVGCIAAELLTGKPLFQGKSVLEQLQKIIEYSGALSQQDLQSLDSPVAECLISQIKPKFKVFSDYFALVQPQLFPLLKGLLKFNPHRRLTAREAMNLNIFNDFFQQNHDNEAYSLKAISPLLNDNKRFNLKDYRKHIYTKIPKQLRAPTNKKQINSNVFAKIQSPKSGIGRKIISKTLDSRPKKESSAHKNRTISKPMNQGGAEKRQFRHISGSKDKKRTLSSSHTCTPSKKFSPYKHEIKLLELAKGSKKHLLIKYQKKGTNIKKIANKERREIRFKKS